MDNASRAARLRPIRARGQAPSDSSAMQYRRSDFDVTNTVQVSSTDAVRRAVCELFRESGRHAAFDRVEAAFRDFERLFNRQLPGCGGGDAGCLVLQDSLDAPLAVARLVV